jgi:DNA repair protein SbcD/Mre11
MRAPPQVRIVHTSDLHLGDPFQQRPAGRHQAMCVCSLLAVLTAASDVGAQAVLIAGDLFDHGRVTHDQVAGVFALLARSGVESVVLPGNHDPWLAGSQYRELADRAGSVHVISDPRGQLVHLGAAAGLRAGLAVWGRALPCHTPADGPLRAEAAPSWGGQWAVAMGHGEYLGSEPPVPGGHRRSSPIVAAEADRLGADYIALGHRHLPEVLSGLSTHARYSGSPMTLQGVAGHVVQVDLSRHGVRGSVRRVVLPPLGCG